MYLKSEIWASVRMRSLDQIFRLTINMCSLLKKWKIVFLSAVVKSFIQ